MNAQAPTLGDGPRRVPLPAALSELTDRVVRGTWLWPSEKRDLRAELESHFHEGLSDLSRQGLSMEESIALLREEFGDPQLAARLIRRGKKRGRPMLWKAIISTLTVTATALGAGGGLAAYLYFAKPSPSVDYVAKLNEPVQQTPEKDRAWPVLREAVLQFRPMPQALESVAKTLPKPGEPLWSAAEEWLLANRSLIPKFREASRKSTYGFIYGDTSTIDYMRQRAALAKRADEVASLEKLPPADPLMPPTIGILLPNLADLRGVARFLIVDSREQLSRGDFTAAWDSLDIAFRIGALLFDGHTLIEQLVGTAILRQVMDEMSGVLYARRDALTPADIKALQASAIMTLPAEQIRSNYNGELIFFHDIVQYVFTDDGKGNGQLIPSQFTKIVPLTDATTMDGQGAKNPDLEALAIAAVHADRRTTVAMHQEMWERMEEQLRRPLYDSRREAAAESIIREIDDEAGGRRYALIKTVMPNLARSDKMIREAAMVREGVRTEIALLAFKEANRRLPERLNELVPLYLDRVPTDAYSGTYLRYSAAPDGQAKLYSVGRDLKDDGGDVTERNDPSAKLYTGNATAPADIVFWPAK